MVAALEAGVLTAGLSSAVATAGSSSTTEILKGPGGRAGNCQSLEPSVSADARFIAFTSCANNWGVNGRNVWLRDRKLNKTVLVSRTRNSQDADFCYYPAVSADGRYVAYTSAAGNLVAGDNNNAYDVFRYDRVNHTTTLVSWGMNGARGHGSSFGHLDISANGRYIAFESSATNLVPHDTNNAKDIFVRDMVDRRTTLVSRGDGAQRITSHADDPSISDDGKYIAFSTFDPLFAGDDVSSPDVYIRDRAGAHTIPVSFNMDSFGAHGGQDPSLSGNGKFVAFVSSHGITRASRSGVAAGPDPLDFVQVSVDALGQPANGSVPATNRAGNVVAFGSSDNDLVAGDTNGKSDVFVRRIAEAMTLRVSVNTAGSQGNNDSPAYGLAMSIDISASGQSVAFQSFATNLAGHDTNNAADVFLHII